MTYFASIDGLRAIAVLAVVFYHFRLPFFDGGFTGVDVFFVISGYLITRLVEEDLRAGRFSFTGFFERRARRLFPALYLVMAVSLLVGIAVLDPEHRRALAESAASQLVFLSNVYFWLGSGYFDVGSVNKPLLHTWTLSLEEQFYLLVSIGLLICSRLFSPRTTYRLVALLTAASLALSVYASQRYPAAAFFLLPTRMFEFLIGSLIALSGALPGRFGTSAFLAGAALIVSAVFFLDPQAIFPGWLALLPALGTALVILAILVDNPLCSRLLSNPALVWVGLRSYSIYLWHWPVWVYLLHGAPGSQAGTRVIAALALTLFLSELSYRYVESPIRRRGMLMSGGSFTAFVGLSMLVLSAPYFVARLEVHVLKYLDPAEYKLVAGRSDRDPNLQCHDVFVSQLDDRGLCSLGEGTGDTKVLVWGDSLAGFASSAIDRALTRVGLSGSQLTRGGCPPLLEEHFEEHRSDRHECTRLRAGVQQYLEENAYIHVLLMANWAAYQGMAEARGQDFTMALRATVSELRRRGLRVMVVENPPMHGDWSPLKLRERYRESGYVERYGMSLAGFRQQAQDHSFVYDIVDEHGGAVLETAPWFCPEGECVVTVDGYPVYTDARHLSYRGGNVLESALVEQLPEALDGD